MVTWQQLCYFHFCFPSKMGVNSKTVTLLHSERPKLHTILAFLRAIGLNLKARIRTSGGSVLSPV